MLLGPVKREAGVSPARTRRCERGAFLLAYQVKSLKQSIALGRRRKAEILKSEDLP